MKLTYALMIAATIAVTSGTELAAQSARVSDIGAAHNFTDDVYNGGRDPGAGFYETDWNTTGEICQPCHTPHGSATGTMAQGLLWSHTLSTTPWPMYTSGAFGSTLDGVQAADAEGWDKLCLSCHDGTVGVDEFAHNSGWQGGGGTPVLLTVGYGTNPWGYDTYRKSSGQGTHPVSITYADPGLNDKNATPMGISGNIVDVLEGGEWMRCASCHDVHEDEVPDGVPHLLRVDNDLSGLCLTCHDK